MTRRSFLALAPAALAAPVVAKEAAPAFVPPLVRTYRYHVFTTEAAMAKWSCIRQETLDQIAAELHERRHA